MEIGCPRSQKAKLASNPRKLTNFVFSMRTREHLDATPPRIPEGPKKFMPLGTAQPIAPGVGYNCRPTSANYPAHGIFQCRPGM